MAAGVTPVQPANEAAAHVNRVETHVVQLQAVTIAAAANSPEINADVQSLTSPPSAAASPLEDVADLLDSGVSGIIRTVVLGLNTLSLPIWWLGLPITYPLYAAVSPPSYGIFGILGWVLGPINVVINLADRLSPGFGTVIREFLYPPLAPTPASSSSTSSRDVLDGTSIFTQDDKTEGNTGGVRSAPAQTDSAHDLTRKSAGNGALQQDPTEVSSPKDGSKVDESSIEEVAPAIANADPEPEEPGLSKDTTHPTRALQPHRGDAKRDHEPGDRNGRATRR